MQIVSVQILRALAALVVAVGHAQGFILAPLEKLGEKTQHWTLLPWGAGVDLFFVISGFIMVYSSEELFGAPAAAKTFAWRRLARIAPLYWAATLVIVVKSLAQHRPLDPAGVLASFLFFPFDTHGDGMLRPIFELGWTLNYEMFFYAVFAGFIFLPRERAAATTALVLTGLVLLAAARPFSAAPLRFWSQPIMLEFVLGMGVAILARREVALSTPQRFALIGLGALAFFYDYPDAAWGRPAISPDDFVRVLGWGAPAALMLAGCVLKLDEAPAGARGLLERAGKTLGDASYALYLWHPMVMAVFAPAWLALGLNGRLPASIAILCCVALSAGAAIAIYRWFERPLTRRLQAWRPSWIFGAAEVAPAAAKA